MAWLPSLVTLLLGILSQSGADQWIASNPKTAGGLMALYALLKGLLPSPMTDTEPPATGKPSTGLRGSAMALCLLLFAPAVSYAVDVTVNGAQVSMTYQEPTQNKTGTPLADLGETTGYYQAPPSAPRVPCVTTPASAPTGGRTITALCVVPIFADQEADVRFTVTATDTSGNESAASVPVDTRLDFLAPDSPK
jgi:hypothetical protein